MNRFIFGKRSDHRPFRLQAIAAVSLLSAVACLTAQAVPAQTGGQTAGQAASANLNGATGISRTNGTNANRTSDNGVNGNGMGTNGTGSTAQTGNGTQTGATTGTGTTNQNGTGIQTGTGTGTTAGSTNGMDTLNSTVTGTDENGNPITTQTRTLRRAVPPTAFQSLVQNSIGVLPPIFGTDLFDQPPSTFAPLNLAAVPNDYIIGPGDTLQVLTVGLYQNQSTLHVDRNGNISYPGVGLISVAGMQYSQLHDYLQQQLGRIYRNFTLTVTLGSLRSIQVYVFGQAQRPGVYTISSLSTLLNAVFLSGGPLPTGSLRDIQLLRGKNVVTHFDVYDLLLHGDKSKDVNLQAGDIIYIPPVGPQVALLGSVTAPAIYELHGETTIDQGIQLSGGLTSTAAATGVRVERIFEHQERSIVDVNLEKDKEFVLHDGDVVTVAAVLQRFRDAVTLRGNVTNPGRYSWHPGMKLAELFPNRDALITRSYYGQRNIVGQPILTVQPLEGRVAVSTAPNVNAATGQTATSTTAAGTTATVNTPTANQTGGGTTVGDALTQSNGTFSATNQVLLSGPDVDLEYAVIERQDPVTLVTSLVPFNLGKLLNEDATQNLPLFPGDVVTIFSKADIRVPSSQQTRFVRLEGEFVQAGLYSVQPGETLRSLIRRAGGLTSEAYLYASEFTRQSTRRIQQQRLQEYADMLEAQIDAQSNQKIANALNANDAASISVSATSARTAVERLRQEQVSGRIVLKLSPDAQGVDSLPDLDLEDGDRFIVSRQPSTVTVAGQVYNASAFLYTPDQQVRNYLRDAGGPDRFGDRKRLFVIRADGSVISEQFKHTEEAAILPGDTIVVPPKMLSQSILRDFMTITTLLTPLTSIITLFALVSN